MDEITEIKKEMSVLAKNECRDLESNHCAADDLLCKLLTILGHADIVADFEKIDKWYA